MQCFLNFWDICPIYLRDMGFFQIIKGIWDTGTPRHLQGLRAISVNIFEQMGKKNLTLFHSKMPLHDSAALHSMTTLNKLHSVFEKSGLGTDQVL